MLARRVAGPGRQRHLTGGPAPTASHPAQPGRPGHHHRLRGGCGQDPASRDRQHGRQRDTNATVLDGSTVLNLGLNHTVTLTGVTGVDTSWFAEPIKATARQEAPAAPAAGAFSCWWAGECRPDRAFGGYLGGPRQTLLRRKSLTWAGSTGWSGCLARAARARQKDETSKRVSRDGRWVRTGGTSRSRRQMICRIRPRSGLHVQVAE